MVPLLSGKFCSFTLWARKLGIVRIIGITGKMENVDFVLKIKW